MRAIVDGIEARFATKEFLPHPAMQGLESFFGNESFRDCPLIAHHYDLKACLMKPPYRVGSARQEFDF